MRHLNRMLFLCALAVFSRTTLALCPSAYTDLGTGCYRFTIQEQLTWHQAYFICQLELNGYLVEINSAQEQTNIGFYIKGVIDPMAENGWWTGASDILTEGTFRWMTSGDSLAYTSWAPDEPNDRNGEDCTYLINTTFLWNDMNCSEVSYEGKTFGAICETDPIE